MSGEPAPGVDAATDHLSVAAVTIAYGAIAAVFGALIAAAPFTVLLDRFVPDDAFYYFNTARVFATSGFSSFDRIHFTNGYHPLWFLVSVPVFWFFPDGGEAPIRVMLVVQVVLGTVATMLMTRLIARLFGAALAAAAGVLWILVMHRVTMNGLETALDTALFAVVFTLFVRYVTERRGALVLGITSGLLFLARTDAGFLLVALGIWFVLQVRRTRSLRDVLAFATPAALIAGLYLATNLFLTGHLMPVSGAAKVYHSTAARVATMKASGASRVSATLTNLSWPIQQQAGWAKLSLGAPIVFMIAGAVIGRMLRRSRQANRAVGRTNLEIALETWPIAAGVWGAFLFYGIVFFGGFSATLWYYPPLVLVGWFYTCATMAAVLEGAPSLPLRPSTAAWAAIGLAFGWLSLMTAALAAATAAVVMGLTRMFSRHGARMASLAVVAIVAALVGGVWTRGISLAMWSAVTAVAVAVGGAIGVERRRFALAHVLAGIVAPAMLIHAVNLRADLKAPPGNWNYHLYLGATWARDHLPESATIWSGSAGILGYFSGHRTVNTDGLANDFDFLENVLKKGRTGAYLRQWDYAIDAMDTDALQQIFPDGCFVPLSAEAMAPPFPDGAGMRRLRIYQMHATGVISCAK